MSTIFGVLVCYILPPKNPFGEQLPPLGFEWLCPHPWTIKALNHCGWFSDGYKSQTEVMNLKPRTLTRTLGQRAHAFHYVAELGEHKPGDINAKFGLI